MKRILVTGGSGFLGRHLVRRLLEKYQDIEVRTISRSENDIQRMLLECDNGKLTPIIGDIREIDTLKYAVKDVDTVVHLAAMKHIDFCQMYPSEAVTINVIGTRNLLESFNGTTFVGMSTDKAVQAISCYGATKLLMEELILEQARKRDKRYMVIRSGNIFGSSGSVIERWKQQIKQSNEITITDPKMSRFFIDVRTLVNFVIKVIEEGENGNIYIPYQKALTLTDLVEAVTGLYGDRTTKIKIVGARTGERQHEILSIEGERVISSLESSHSENSLRWSVEEIRDSLKVLDG